MKKYSSQQQFIIVEQWMWEDLHLSGNELIVFGLIYGLHKQGKSFFGSGEYVMKLCSCSEPTAYSILNKLNIKGYLSKREFHNHLGWKSCEYTINNQFLPKMGKNRKINIDQQEVF